MCLLPPPLCFAMQNIGEELKKKIICLKNLTPLPCGHSPYLISDEQGERAKMRFEDFSIEERNRVTRC